MPPTRGISCLSLVLYGIRIGSEGLSLHGAATKRTKEEEEEEEVKVQEASVEGRGLTLSPYFPSFLSVVNISISISNRKCSPLIETKDI